MTKSILASDIPGSEVTYSCTEDYRSHRATRKFYVNSDEDKDDTIIWLRDQITTLYPFDFSLSNSKIPLQTIKGRKVGRDRWVFTADYYYPF